MVAFSNVGILPAVLAKILQLLKRLRVTLTQEQIDALLQRASTTHQPLKVSLFKILSKQNCDLIALTDEFSRPDQLTIFREAAAKAITSFNEKLIPTYLRLLQDEDS